MNLNHQMGIITGINKYGGFIDDKYTFCFRDYDGELIETKLIKQIEYIKDNNNNNTINSNNKTRFKYKYMLIPETIDDRIIILNDKLIDYSQTNQINKLNHFYRKLTLFHRPRIVRFNLQEYLLKQSIEYPLLKGFYIDVRPLSISFECNKHSLWNHKWSKKRINNIIDNLNNKLTVSTFFSNVLSNYK